MKISKTFARYVVRHFLNSFMVVFAIMGSLIAVFDLIDLLRKAAGKTTLSQLIVFKMLCLRLPMHIQEILPFIILFTAILTFWRLNRYSEITILRTSGLSIWQILSPLLSVALIIGLIDLIFLSPFASKMMGRFEFYESKYLNVKEQAFNLTDTGIWLRESVSHESRIYHIGHIDDANQFNNISVYIFSNQNHFLKRYEANVGYLNNGQLILKNAHEIQNNQPPTMNAEIILTTQLSLTKIQNAMADPRTLPFWTLPHYYSLMEKSGLSGQRYLLRLHSLLARSLWLAVMVLLAATFSLGHVRLGQTSKMVALGIMSAFLLYFFREIMITLSQVGKIPNVLGAWAPTCITGLIATTKLLYSEDG